MLSNLSTLTNDPLSLWEWTVPDEGYCTGSTAPGESQFTNMKRKSRKNANHSKNITTALGGPLFYIFTDRFLKKCHKFCNCTAYFVSQLSQRSQWLDKMSMTKGLGVRQFINSAPLLMTADCCHWSNSNKEAHKSGSTDDHCLWLQLSLS